MLLPAVTLLTGLVVSAAAGACPKTEGSQMTDAFRKKFLDEHNRLRSLVANGRAKDKDGSYVPKAANMLKLRYDCSLERLAAEHVNQCKLAPSKASGARAALGESLIRSTGRTLADQADVTTGLWFLDLEKNGMGRNLTFGAQPDVYKIGHYTQIVWATTRTIGCAVKECEGSTMAVCNYRPTGNILGMMVYKEGEPCSKCPKGAMCENGLCVVRTIISTTINQIVPVGIEEVEAGTLAAVLVPNVDAELCPYFNGSQMTDAFRRKFLEEHNAYRSLVANGLAIDKDGSTVPMAANMLRLRYDCTLERLAVEHANECKLRHSEPKGVRSALGESLVQSIGRTLPEQSEVTTGLWFNELHKNGMGRNLTFGAQEDVYKIGHYTQVVWATTGAIGCAVKECPDGNLAVCNYQPTGNVLEQEVYEEGDPCSKCPDHTYCEDGLCVVEYPVDE
ncbi:hypothetical protein Q1695_007169 [Nippostrongylus brasiliensis]|nr:hypothetical protein Q1695_007169 [Nippostrongylus brasiliensis]